MSLARIDTAIDAYDHPTRRARRVYGMFSGGHDSLAATYLASRHPQFAGVLHVNTQTGIPKTRDFVEEVCRDQGWTLHEVKSKDDCGEDYEALVLEHGFPGPALHWKMFQRLKERALRHFMRTVEPGLHRVVLVSGRRSQESDRRKANVTPHDRSDRIIYASIIHDWSALDVTDFLEAEGLPRNPVVDLLHMSGECLCGAFAHPGELDEIRLWFPEVASRIERLERRVRRRGFGWGWEGKPPSCGGHPGQMALEFPPLCSSCVLREAA